MSLRYLLLLLLVIYVIFEFFIPVMQNVFGYGFGTLLAIFVIWYVIAENRRTKIL